jgi:hypothetical protein
MSNSDLGMNESSWMIISAGFKQGKLVHSLVQIFNREFSIKLRIDALQVKIKIYNYIFSCQVKHNGLLST